LKESQKVTLPSVLFAEREGAPSAPAPVVQEPKVAPILSPQKATAVLLARAEIPSSARANEHIASSTFSVYVIKRGDNLTRIAKAHGTTVKAIRAVNQNISPDRIAVGQKIRLPSDKQPQVAM
jgi:LysM repeat protein